MKSILRALYNGKIYPSEEILPVNSDYNEVNKKISDEMEFFEKKFSKEEYEKIGNLLDLNAESSSMVEEQSFLYGFKLGTLLMIEAFMGRDELGR